MHIRGWTRDDVENGKAAIGLEEKNDKGRSTPKARPVGKVMQRVSTGKKTVHIIVTIYKSWIRGARLRAILGGNRDIRICSNPPSDVARCAAESRSREGKRRINRLFLALVLKLFYFFFLLPSIDAATEIESVPRVHTE
jgi:hypothetical protein